MEQVKKTLKTGFKIFGGVTQVIGTCVIFYALLCALTAAKEYKDTEKRNQLEAKGDSLQNIRAKLTTKAQKNAAYDRARIVTMEVQPLPEIKEHKAS